MAERINRHMHLDALFTLGSIVACACAAGRGLNGAAIDDGSGLVKFAVLDGVCDFTAMG